MDPVTLLSWSQWLAMVATKPDKHAALQTIIIITKLFLVI